MNRHIIFKDNFSIVVFALIEAKLMNDFLEFEFFFLIDLIFDLFRTRSQHELIIILATVPIFL